MFIKNLRSQEMTAGHKGGLNLRDTSFQNRIPDKRLREWHGVKPGPTLPFTLSSRVTRSSFLLDGQGISHAKHLTNTQPIHSVPSSRRIIKQNIILCSRYSTKGKKGDVVKFFDHDLFLFKGCAVINFSTISPVWTNQTLRINLYRLNPLN